ncbi:MAG: hypothetical protein ABJC26_07030 [Gemmatimonadaceae bacterium]
MSNPCKEGQMFRMRVLLSTVLMTRLSNPAGVPPVVLMLPDADDVRAV